MTAPPQVRLLVAGQSLLVLMILLACATVPRAQGASLLLPLPGFAAGPGGAFALRHGFRLIGKGRMRGSLVVAGAGPKQWRDALCAGFILINVPRGLCGAARTNP